MHHPPVAITKIVDPSKHEVIYEDESESIQAIGPSCALQQVVHRTPPPSSRWYRDAWFGGTP